MRLQHLELNGFKSFAKKTSLDFISPVVCIVGPNGSGKSNVVEAFRFVLGEQSIKSMRGKSGSDLIFKGSKNLSKGSVASVSIYLDNTDKVFKLHNDNGENIDLNYDTIIISRTVYADGLNKYVLNGGEVRLKDINNLLASVHIGASGHHIISQGEADRILNATPKDRKEMIEEALGLKVYQYRIKDSVRKLERANTNMQEVNLLRRENAPHISFLKKQVEKFEKMKELRLELASLYKEYFRKESFYLEKERSFLVVEKSKIQTELAAISLKMSSLEDFISVENNKNLEELKNTEASISNIRRTKNEMERKLGRIEGMIEMEEMRRLEKKEEEIILSPQEIKNFIFEVDSFLAEALVKENIHEIKNILQNIKNILDKFNKKEEIKDDSDNYSKIDEINNLKNIQKEVTLEMDRLLEEENKLLELIKNLKIKIDLEIESGRDKEREKFSLKVKYQEILSTLELNNIKEENLVRSINALEIEKKEGEALIGQEIYTSDSSEIEQIDNFDRSTQDEVKRKIDRLKIKLEDGGIGDANEILREYQEMTERDLFLIKEIEDLNKSILSLNLLIEDLKNKIDIEFKEGIKNINVQFNDFFSIMFGGGSANLTLIVENKKKRIDKDTEYEEDENEIIFEQGIEIDVSLPHKKVKELHSLSGGERSLTSIALLFAMSAVNPPPFLILDETDAALDEANSRKYGDMIEKLSKQSQLIVVTHNRETMSRAGVLYGVTVGGDGASKLLSVQFDEAQAIAK